VVDVGFFSGRDAAVDLMHYLVVDEFEEDASGAFVEYLLNGGPVCFVFVLFLFDHFFLFAAADFVGDFMQVDFGVEFGEGVLVVYFCFAAEGFLGFLFALLDVVLFYLSLDGFVVGVCFVVGGGGAGGAVLDYVDCDVVGVVVGLCVGIEVEGVLADGGGVVGLLKHINVNWTKNN
jgi:hypothetical protein